MHIPCPSLCIVGAASISAFPLFSGFVSKSMVMSTALSEGYHWIWLALLFASAGVFHHAGQDSRLFGRTGFRHVHPSACLPPSLSPSV